MSPFPPHNPSGSGGSLLMDIAFVVAVIIVCLVIGFFIWKEGKDDA